MVTRQRERRPETNTPRPEGGGDTGGQRDALRRRAQDLLSAGDSAIAKALSRDSREFLKANQQQGGQ